MPTATDARELELDADGAAPGGSPADDSSMDAALDKAIRSAEALAAEVDRPVAEPEFLDVERMLAEAGAQTAAGEALSPDAAAPDLNSIDEALAAFAGEQADEQGEAAGADGGASPTEGSAPETEVRPATDADGATQHAASLEPVPAPTTPVDTDVDRGSVDPADDAAGSRAVEMIAAASVPALGAAPTAASSAPRGPRVFPGLAIADRVLCKLESIPFKTSQTLGWASVVTAVNAATIWFVVLQRPPADQAPAVIAVPAEVVHDAKDAHGGDGHDSGGKKDSDGHGKEAGGHADSKAKKKPEPKKKPEKKGGAKKKDDGHH